VLWPNEVAGRLVRDDPGAIELSHEHVEHIAQAGGSVAHSVGKMQPTFVGLDGRGAHTVLYFLNGVVLPIVDDDFVVNDGLLNALGQAPSDAATFAGLDEVVLRARVEGILAIDKLGMEP